MANPEIEQLTDEVERLRQTLKLIYHNAAPGSTVANLARDALACKPDGSCRHSVAELARLEGMTTAAVYKAKQRAHINGGMIVHSEWNRARL